MMNYTSLMDDSGGEAEVELESGSEGEETEDNVYTMYGISVKGGKSST